MLKLSLDPKVFEETFNSLLSDKARIYLLERMQRKGMDFPDTYVDSLADRLEESGDFLSAADLLSNFGRTERAMELSLKGDSIPRAINIASEAGMNEKVIELALQQGWQARAIETARQISSDRLKEVVKTVLENLDFFNRHDAAGLARVVGQNGFHTERSQIIASYFAAVDENDPESIKDAAEFAEDLDLKNKAAQLYLQIGDFDAALKVDPDYGVRNEIRSAKIEKLLGEGKIKEAADLAEKFSDHKRASDLYEQAGEFEKAADVVRYDDKQAERVLGLYIKARSFRAAAEVAKRQGMLREAKIFAWRHVKSIDKEKDRHHLEYVAEFAQEMGLEIRAQQLYLESIARCEEGGHYGLAKDVAKKAGMEDREKFYEGLESLFSSR